jgi:glycosyltransferase involved in cell wall biosynthesis
MEMMIGQELSPVNVPDSHNGNIIRQNIKNISGGVNKSYRIYPFKIIVLTWEYPPNVVGGLARHVYGLSGELSKMDIEVHIITSLVDELPPFEKNRNCYIYRVKPYNENDPNFISWIGGLNLAMVEKANELMLRQPFQLVHAHDWLVGVAAICLKKRWGVPLITTIHATESGRNYGIYTEMQKFIQEKERLLIKSSDQLIVCSQYMKTEIRSLFKEDEGKISVIPNGVESKDYYEKHDDLLSNLPIDRSKRMVFSIGRMVKEKGFDILIEAAKMMKESISDVYFLVAGKGPMLADYRLKVKEAGLEDYVYFIGYISDEVRDALIASCELAVFPSRYEPFGIVALETMVMGKPTIVTNTGGFMGIVNHLITGLIMESNSAESFIEQASLLLNNRPLSNRIGNAGKQRVKECYGWESIAMATKRLYDTLLLNAKKN